MIPGKKRILNRQSSSLRLGATPTKALNSHLKVPGQNKVSPTSSFFESSVECFNVLNHKSATGTVKKQFQTSNSMSFE